MTAPSRRYQPFYCEENAFWLCQASQLADRDPRMLFIANRAKRCALWCQRLAPPDAPLVWDYHVVVVADGDVWDLDTRLALPTPLAEYLARTFPHGDDLGELAPRFRLLEKKDALATFASDRRHMRTVSGWQAPPPPWPIIGDGRHTLPRLLDPADDIAGQVFDLIGLRAWADANTR